MDWVPPKSPLKNGLFVRNPLPNAWLLFLSKISRQKSSSQIPINPKKILLCNIANLGDVVISTTVLPVIKRHFPNCKIGFLTSSASAVVLKEHPSVSQIHTLDHWYLQRHLGKCKAALHYWKSRRKLLQELREARYDVAIDLYSYFPNAIPLLAKSQIPIRIGYPTGGFSGLLTHSVEWNFPDRYLGHAHLHLLTPLGIDVSGESPLPSYYFKKKTSDYVVAHMGSLQELKEWGHEKWVELIQRLERSGRRVILTGKGKREGDLCRHVAEKTSAKDLSNKLSWSEFVSTIQEARLLVSVDSVSVHIAAGALTPVIVPFAGINSPHMWLPRFPLCRGMMARVPCSPCFSKKGCSTMQCIKGIEVGDVYAQAMEFLKITEYTARDSKIGSGCVG